MMQNTFFKGHGDAYHKFLRFHQYYLMLLRGMGGFVTDRL